MAYRDIYERAYKSYIRNLPTDGISVEPSKALSGLEMAEDGDIYVLRNSRRALAAFFVHPTGRLGKRVPPPGEKMMAL